MGLRHNCHYPRCSCSVLGIEEKERERARWRQDRVLLPKFILLLFRLLLGNREYVYPHVSPQTKDIHWPFLLSQVAEVLTDELGIRDGHDDRALALPVHDNVWHEGTCLFFFASVFQFEDLGLIMHLWRLIYDVTNVPLRPARWFFFFGFWFRIWRYSFFFDVDMKRFMAHYDVHMKLWVPTRHDNMILEACLLPSNKYWDDIMVLGHRHEITMNMGNYSLQKTMCSVWMACRFDTKYANSIDPSQMR